MNGGGSPHVRTAGTDDGGCTAAQSLRERPHRAVIRGVFEGWWLPRVPRAGCAMRRGRTRGRSACSPCTSMATAAAPAPPPPPALCRNTQQNRGDQLSLLRHQGCPHRSQSRFSPVVHRPPKQIRHIGSPSVLSAASASTASAFFAALSAAASSSMCSSVPSAAAAAAVARSAADLASCRRLASCASSAASA